LTRAGSGLGTGAPAVSEEAAGLLRRAKDGDRTAFAEILARHERMVLMTALRLLGRLDMAQDAAQETFLRLHKYLDGFDEVRALAPWLYRVVVNVCRDAQRRDRSFSLEALQGTGQLPEPAARIDLEGDAMRQEERRLVAEALQSLPEKERAAVVLRDIEGLETEEVAEILGSSATTVRSQVCRGRLKLRAVLERRLKVRR
jgi:RNA polymerase sigma-70 factor, ECF subfamily